MKLPPNMTEEEVLETIENVVNRLAHKFKFGNQEIDDIKQQGRLEALKLIKKGVYNPSLPLENFLFVHVRNRLENYRRDNSKRNEPPCLQCPFYDPYYYKSTNQCSAFLNKDHCDKWALWKTHTLTKQSIIQPLDITNINDESEDNMKIDFDVLDNINRSEIFNKINEELDVSMRADWLRMKAGVSIPRNRKEKIIEEVRRILGICPENVDL